MPYKDGQESGEVRSLLDIPRYDLQFGSTVDLSLSLALKVPEVLGTSPVSPSPHLHPTMQASADLNEPNAGEKESQSTLVSPSRPIPGTARKNLMLFLFCFAEFMDSFIGSALYPAIRVIEEDLHVGPAEITWAFAAYSSTFAAFLLISGRLSDVYSASKSITMT